MKNLRLRQESYTQPRKSAAFAGVLVDTGIFHLDEIFDYRIPVELKEEVQVGSRVQVTFHGIKREGIVYEVRPQAATTGRILSIEKVLGAINLISPRTIELVEETCHRWAGARYDIWRSALPQRIIAAERNLAPFAPSRSAASGIKRPQSPLTYLMLPPFQRVPELLAKVVTPYLKSGNVLLVMADEKEIELFLSYAPITNVINFSSSLSKSQRYQNYLVSQGATGNLIIGNRSAIFADIPNLAAIVVHREISENHYEQRSPGWNTRDVALIRHAIEKVPVVFTGYGPSSEMALAIDQGRVTAPIARRRVNVSATPSQMGELIPSKLVPLVRSATKKGSVLMLVPRKGYSSGLVCARCRNVIHHQCGGVLTKTSLKGSMTCSSCQESVERAQCPWCKSEKFHITGRGSARIVEEIGKSFPGVAIKESTSETIITDVGDFRGIIIATSGAQPLSSDGYSGVFILEAERFLAGIDMRSAERSAEAFFASCSLAADGAHIGITLPPENPLVATIIRWSPDLVMKRELAERESALLPPFVRVIDIEIPQTEIATIENGLRKAVMDGRLATSLRINRIKETLRLLVPHEDAPQVVEFIFQFQRKRSLSGKKLLTFRVDPYTLH